MKVVARTDEYTIYQKRSERYAVKSSGKSSGKDSDKGWVNGDAKVAILLQHKLIEAPTPKAPEPEPEPEAAPEAASEEEGAASAEEAPAEEASAEQGSAEQGSGEETSAEGSEKSE